MGYLKWHKKYDAQQYDQNNDRPKSLRALELGHQHRNSIAQSLAGRIFTITEFGFELRSLGEADHLRSAD